jgi:AcrR family transcriptional regulator
MFLRRHSKPSAKRRRLILSTRGSACCRRHSRRFTNRVSRVPDWTNSGSNRGYQGRAYYHFDGKEARGHAIVDEVIAVMTRDKWLLPLRSGGDPIETLINIVRATSLRPEAVRGGYPLNNLAQEMSPLDEKFRKRLARVFHVWQEGIATALRRGQTQGTLRRDLNPDETSSFLIAVLKATFRWQRMLKM